jgi:DNA-directed RNA polymerase specialized sigma24 family protein
MYDPTRASLPTFLRLIARRDLCNLLVQEKRHQRGRMPWNHVEHSLLARNEEQNDMLWSDYPNLLNVIAAFDDTDRQVFELMKDGERRTAVFAAALGLTDKPADEQIAMVKRAKDRIMARLRRAGGHDE